MSRTHVDHRDLVRFAEERVNLPKEKADEFRAQARRLREKLETDPQNPVRILTVRGAGYKLVAPEA